MVGNGKQTMSTGEKRNNQKKRSKMKTNKDN
jgi:hypothetical protein